MDSMAEPYFKDRAFFKEIQVCSNPACNWMGIKNQKKDEKFSRFQYQNDKAEALSPRQI